MKNAAVKEKLLQIRKASVAAIWKSFVGMKEKLPPLRKKMLQSRKNCRSAG